MKFFLDENIPRSIADYLHENGHDVIDIRGTEHEGVNDNSIFQMAQEENAVFITTDRDFFHTVPFKYDHHFGIVVISLQQPNRYNILEKVKWVVEKFNLEEFESKVILLRDNHYKVYQ